MKLVVRHGLVALASVALIASGCASESESGPAESALPASTASSTTTSVAVAQSYGAQELAEPAATGPDAAVVELGAPYSIPCVSTADTCMNVTIMNIRENVPCDRSSPLRKEQAIAIDVYANMPSAAAADPSFTSPFRSFPWATFSSDDRFTNVQTTNCGGDYSGTDLMSEFPGGYAQATIYLDAPKDVRAVVFEPIRGQMLLIEAGS